MMTTSLTSSPATVELPHDVILEVIDQLDVLEDKQTLANLCLVSSATRLTAQKRLFSFIHFIYIFRRAQDGSLPLDRNNDTKSFRFLRIINEFPHLARYVRHFSFELDFMDNRRIVPSLPKSSSWLDLVPRLTSLRGFYWKGRLTEPWSTYHVDMTSVVESALRSSTLTTVVIRGAAFLSPSIITHCPNLRTLDVASIKSHTEGEEYGIGPVYLHSLVMGTRAYSVGIGEFVQSFNPLSEKTLSISHLTSLSIPTEYLDAKHITSILSFCSSSLSELNLMVPREAVYLCTPVNDPVNVEQVCPIVDLSALQHLAKLEIRGRIKAKWLDNWKFELANSPLPWIGCVLDTLPVNFGSNSQGPSQIGLRLEVEDLSVPSLEALRWAAVTQPLLFHQQQNSTAVRIDISCYYFTYDNTLNSVPRDIPTMPTLIPERIDIMENNTELQKLGRSVVFDRTQVHDFRLTGY